MKEMGFDVELARSVSSALAIDIGEVDVIVSDVGLPDGTGLDLIRKLQANGRHRPAIAVSGFGMESDVKASKEAGFDLHLTKPDDFEMLFDAIRTLSSGIDDGEPGHWPIVVISSPPKTRTLLGCGAIGHYYVVLR